METFYLLGYDPTLTYSDNSSQQPGIFIASVDNFTTSEVINSNKSLFHIYGYTTDSFFSEESSQTPYRFVEIYDELQNAISGNTEPVILAYRPILVLLM